MMTLEGTLPFAKKPDTAVSIADDLSLDVTCRADESLDVDPPVAKCRQCFGASSFPGRFEILFVVDPSNSLSSSTAGGLEKQWISDPFGFLL